MPTLIRRFFFFSLIIGGAMLWWPAYNSGATALPQTPTSIQAQNQSAIVPLDGETIFRNYCASCHGLGGEGDGPVTQALKVKPSKLTTLTQRNHGQFPAERVRRIVAGDEVSAAHGSREMPIWGPMFHQIDYDRDLGYVRLQNVTEYLKTLQRK